MMKTDVLGQRRHVVCLTVGDKELIVGTDDINDVVSRPWFSKLLGVQDAPPVQPVVQQVVQQPQEPQRDDRIINSQIGELRGAIVEIYQELRKMREQAQAAQPVQVQVQQPQVVEVAQPPEMPKSAAPPPQMQQPQRISPGVRMPKPEYMTVPPEKMTEQMWNQLNGEQQMEWMRNWKLM